MRTAIEILREFGVSQMPVVKQEPPVVLPTGPEWPPEAMPETTDSAAMYSEHAAATSEAISFGIVVTPLRSPCSRSPGFTHSPPTRSGLLATFAEVGRALASRRAPQAFDRLAARAELDALIDRAGAKGA